MKILLINTNRNRFLAPPPVGLAYITASLKKAKHDIKLLDFMFMKDPKRVLKNTLKKFNPDVVGFSIRNLDNQSMLELKIPLREIHDFINIVKEFKIVTVLGGTAFTTFPKQMLSYMGGDYGIAGQGEKSFPLLLDYLEGKGDQGDVPGLVYRKDGIITENPMDISGYDEDIVPDWSLVDPKKYRRSIWPVTIIVKSGCPYSCSYCDAHATFGKCFHYRDAESIIKEIKNVIQLYNIRVFYFSDPCFNVPIDRAKSLLKKIIDEKLNIVFSTTLLPIRGYYDEEYFRLYRKAGGSFAILGVESFSQRMLKAYKKPFTISEIYECSMLAHRQGVNFGLELLIGGPGENEATVRESMAFVPRIKSSLLMYSIGIRILPDTDIYKKAIEEGIIKSEEDLLFPRFYLSKNLDMEWAQKYIRKCFNRYWYRSLGMIPCGIRNSLARYFNIII